MNKKLRQIGITDESFELVKVSDLIKRKIIAKPLDGNHGEIHPKGEDFVESGVPFIMASDINDGQINFQSCKFITVKQAESLRKGFAKNGDVLLTHKASIGRTAIVDYKRHPFIMLTPQVTYYRVLDNNKLHNRYLKYYFDSELFLQTLKLWAGAGSTRAYLGITAQYNLPVILPPIEKQQKISAILSAYDGLIENNKRRIALLEKMAEEIYREWFVRFRFPGYQNVEFDKGIPKGWGSKKLPQVADLTYGFPFQSNRFNDCGIGKQIIRIRNIPTSSTDDYTDEVVDSRYIVKTGDLIVGMDGEFHINHWYGEEAYLVQRVCKVHAKERDLSGYLALAIKRPIKHLESILLGATVGHLGAKHLNEIDILIPPDNIKTHLQIFNEIELQKRTLSVMNRNLNQVKNQLLPRLISGRLSVEELDIQFPPSMLQDEVA